VNKNMDIKIEHVTRVEGHGNIVLNARNGKVEKVEWQVSEAPRFFEAMCRGRSYVEIPPLVSRVCGICSIAHTLAGVKAVENALGVTPSQQTIQMRKLASHGENMQSHMLHIGYLVAPDLFEVGSVFPLIKTSGKILKKIISLHSLANEICDVTCGRTTHPLSLDIGGLTYVPSEGRLEKLEQKIRDALSTAYEVADVILSKAEKLPNFNRETEYIGLKSKTEYALYDGVIGSTDTGEHKLSDYISITNEYVVPSSTAKFTKHARDSYMVGALARCNLNYSFLSPLAKEISTKFGFKTPCFNPFMNTIAQLIEVFDSLNSSIELIENLLSEGIKEEKYEVKPGEGHGIGAVEAPRGILIHEYYFDSKGRCTRANLVIPTNQNHANIQKDMELFAPMLLSNEKTEKEVELNLEMLVRAYDPCISCSTHYIKVKWI
jgi:coenzyme F420-reducing hydrogenase alpha subunit